MANAENRFVSEFNDTKFRHSDELISEIHSGAIRLHSVSESSEQKASAYFDIYHFRSKRLLDRIQTDHVRSLSTDIKELCDELSRNLTEPCDLWIFEQNPYFSFSVFVGRDSRAIMGCIRAVDDRLIDDEVRRELWGHKDE